MTTCRGLPWWRWPMPPPTGLCFEALAAHMRLQMGDLYPGDDAMRSDLAKVKSRYIELLTEPAKEPK